jgi:hypothetical protein
VNGAAAALPSIKRISRSHQRTGVSGGSRITLLTLIFLGLALDSTGEGPWNSPVASVGRFLTDNLNKTIPVGALTIPVMALVLGCLLIIRLLSGGVGRMRTASPMLSALGCSFLTLIVLVSLGSLRGGDIQMAKNQVQSFVLLVLLAYLLAGSLRGVDDFRILGKLIIAAAIVKSLMAVWVWYTIEPPPSTAVTHGDSLLFACAVMILIARFAEQPIRRNARLCLMILPVLVAGMIANSRRLVWVEIFAAVLTLYFISRPTPLKRHLTRGVLASLPLLLVYVAAGWNSQSSLFAPVKLFRSVEDANVDSSTLFREVENYNLLYTFRQNPLMGTGFGHPYVEVIKNEDISFFKEYRFFPHNSVLGLLGFTGVFGFTGLSMALVVGVFLSARSYHWARSPDERVAAVTALTMVMIYEIQSWGDIGFSEKKSIFLVGAALTVAGQLAVSTGAWGGRPGKAAVVAGQL